MTRKQAEDKIREIANDDRLQITGSRGDWYIDNREGYTLDRRGPGHRTLTDVIEYVEFCVKVEHPIIHL